MTHDERLDEFASRERAGSERAGGYWGGRVSE